MALKSLVLCLLIAGSAHAAGEKSAGSPPAKSRAPVVAAEEDLLGRTVYQALVGDLALRQGDTELAVSAWADLARRTRDPQVLARAVEVASLARQTELAIELSRLWVEVAPDAAKARQVQSTLLLMGGHFSELAPKFAELLAQDPAALPSNLMHLNRMLARHPDKGAILRLVERLTAPYPAVPEAQFAVAQAALQAGERAQALTAIGEALRLRPDWEAGALLRAQIQVQGGDGVDKAMDDLEAFLSRYPAAHEARAALARLLVGEKRFSDARAQFDRLLKDMPDNPDVLYPLAVLALQQGDAATARKLLEHLLTSDFRDRDAVRFFLGQLEESAENPAAALTQYQAVQGGEHLLRARFRSAQLLEQQGQLEAALGVLQSTPARNAGERSQLIMAQAQLLRDAGRLQAAYALIDDALTRDKDNTDLLYELSMVAERLERHDVAEKRLRQLLRINPEHAHGLNALGYLLAERNDRLDEAERLIRKALEKAPGDPFITDSLGWVQYRQGKLDTALQTLRTAYATKGDPEIAAHIGEVLWMQGRRDEARQWLRDALAKYPDHAVLKAAVARFAGS